MEAPMAEGSEIKVTRDSDEGPEACRPAQAGELLSRFLAAFSAGDVRAAEYFSEDMEWYSMSEWAPKTGKRHFVTHDRAGLRRYIERRAAEKEQMRLLELRVQFDETRNLGHLAYSIERTADDLLPTKPIVIGKGAIDCETGRLHLLSMGHDTRFQQFGSCPGRADGAEVALACAG